MVQLKGDRVGVYARYSSDKQNETSVEDQVARARTWLRQYGRELDERFVFTDSAISGASARRPGLERARRAVVGGELDVLLVEDVSRLSRDQGDADRIYKELAFHRVQLITMADGIDSSSKSSRLTFGMKALIGETYLDDLRDKTVRGMLGAAQRGHSTGGLPFGYRSVALPGADPRRPAGFRVEIDPEKREVVLRIFSEYAEGRAFAAIADRLNRDAVPSPRAGSRHKRKACWMASSIRAILYNPKYIGEWAFNETQWVKEPSTNRRIPRKKDASEVVHLVHPERRIVPTELWDAVQKRLQKVRALYTVDADGTKKGRAAAGHSSSYALSSLLVCGQMMSDGTHCGAPMVIHGSAKSYKCADYATRHTCANGVFVREELVRRRLLEALEARVGSPEALDYLRKKYAQWLGERERSRGGELAELRGRLQRTETRLLRGNEVLLDGHDSPSLRQTIRDLEAEAEGMRRTVNVLEQRDVQPVRLPSLEQIFKRMRQLEELVRQDPVAAREAIRKILDGGHLQMLPQSDGTYVVQAEFYPLVLILGTGVEISNKADPRYQCRTRRNPTEGFRLFGLWPATEDHEREQLGVPV